MSAKSWARSTTNVNASAASDHVHEAEPESVQRGKWATATWREGNTIYMLALEGTRDQLQSYLL
jgi:hypothetical protein